METKGRLFVLLCAGFFLLALPAQGAVFEIPAQRPTAQFQRRGTNHYGVSFTVGDGGSTISAFSARAGGGSAFYFLTWGSVSRKGIHANLGRLGSIALRFHRSGKTTRRAQKNCRGGPEVVMHGTFVGRIRFDGEAGYTKVATSRVRGSLSFAPRRFCHFPDGEVERPRPRRKERFVTRLMATASRPGRYVTFSASRSDREPVLTQFDALMDEERGAMSVLRFVDATADATAFPFAPSLDSATVAPPAPFEGTAAFTRIDDFATRWEGPLTVDFPGRPDVPLTGREFTWSLSREPESDSSISFTIVRSRLKHRLAE